jgi:hypothetical protein
VSETTPGRATDAGIDDLLSFGDDDEPVAEPVRQRSRAGWLLRNALLTVAATAATVVLLRLAGIRVSVLLVAAAFIALRALHLLLAEVAPPPVPGVAARRRPGEEDGLYRWSGSDGLRGAVRRWESRLDWSQTDAGRFSRNVLPELAELADERLRQRHGITRASDPRRARDLLGEPLWQLLAEPGRRPPKARDWAALVAARENV